MTGLERLAALLLWTTSNQAVESATERSADRVDQDGAQTALVAEMNENLWYHRHGPAGRDVGNSRNGTRIKTVLTEITIRSLYLRPGRGPRGRLPGLRPSGRPDQHQRGVIAPDLRWRQAASSGLPFVYDDQAVCDPYSVSRGAPTHVQVPVPRGGQG